MGSEQFEVLIVGAGFGGIGAAIQLKRLGIDDFVILDREDDLGGTWHVNHYPGLAVDVPTTTYSYFFEPNPNWSRLFTPGAEIKQYAAGVADKYDVRRHMRFNTVVESARWDEETRRWEVALAGGDVMSARYLITATGFLSQPKTPDIPGITTLRRQGHPHDRMGGRLRSDGPPDRDHRNRRNGGAADPETRREGRRPHRLPAHRRSGWRPRSTCGSRSGPKGCSRGCRGRSGRSGAVTDTIYELMITVGVVRYRVPLFRRLNISAMDLCKINQFLAIRDKELRRKLTPDYDLGCKRPTFSNSYFRSFTKPHVHLQADGIERVEADGIVNADGSKTHHRHAGAGHRDSTCGRPTSRPSR